MTPPYSPPGREAAPPTSAETAPGAGGRFWCTSVIRHTSDVQHSNCSICPREDSGTRLNKSPEKNIITQAATSQNTGAQEGASGLASCVPPVSGVSLVPVLCQVLPSTVAPRSFVSQQQNLTATVQTRQKELGRPPSTRATLSSQLVLVGAQVTKGPIAFLVPQPAVPAVPARPPPAPRFPAIAPAPGTAGQRQPQPAASRARSHVCPHHDCRKTYFKSSHLKAHIRMHTGK